MRTRMAAVTAATSVLVGMGVGAALFAPGGAGARPGVEAAAPAAFEKDGEGRLAAAAAAIGITEAELRAALEDGRTIAAVAKEHGVDVEKVIDALVAEAQAGLRERITGFVNGERPFKHRRHRMQMFLSKELAAAATAIGVTEEELRAALGEGKTIAAVAREHGVAVPKVVGAMVAAAKAALEERVAAGRLTRAQADRIESALTGRITRYVNSGFPRRR